MAKVGEGDNRWIVKERGDGKNVNNWHWSETNCLKFTENGLRDKIMDMDLLEGDSELGPCRITSLNKCDGDCYTYNRKSKLHLFYDMTMQFGWKGIEEGVEGTIDLPNVSDEIEEEPMEIQVSTSSKHAKIDKIKESIRRKGRDLLQALILSFLQDMKATIHSKSIASTSTSNNNSNSDSNEQTTASAASTPASSSSSATTTSKPVHQSTDTVTLRFQFGCSTGEIYDFLTNAQRISYTTRAPAVIDARVGGKMEMFAGAVSGTYLELVPGEKIVQSWRMSSWAENAFSNVTITLMTADNGTTLTLHQTNIPSRDQSGFDVIKQVEEGWRSRFFQQMKAASGWSFEEL